MMYRVCVFGWVAFLLLIPSITDAAVVINEVAWMGDDESANNEWIELHNNGSDVVDVTGWELTSDAGLTIGLDGALAAGDYAVLERSDDASAPGVAFAIYAGALSNAGATLRLYNAVGDLVDQAAGGENWENVGGDNVTKETAQYTNGGWVTGVATPGSVNVTTGSGNETAVPETTDKTDGDSGGETIELINDGVLAVRIVGPTTVLTNQPVIFTAVPTGLGATALQSLAYEWHLGDLATTSGMEVTHEYAHAGTYVVSVSAAFAEFTAAGRHTVTVLPVRVSLTYDHTGDILIHNDVPYEQDLSGYRVFGTQTVILPEHTYVLANGTLRVPRHMVRPAEDVPVVLYTPGSQRVASTQVAPATYQLATPESAPAVAITPAVLHAPSPVVTEPVPEVAGESTSTLATATPQILHTTQTQRSAHANSRQLYALWFVFIAAILLILFRKRL